MHGLVACADNSVKPLNRRPQGCPCAPYFRADRLKTHVVNEQENTRIPFLRGILTRSLLDSGLPFEDAFQLATEIRDELSDTPEVSSFELRRKVMSLLEGRGHEEVLEPYRLPVVAAPAPIRVIGPDGAREKLNLKRRG